jgi:hypothetical protein
MKLSRSQLAITIGSLAWLLLVIALYYAGHKPFTPAMLLRIGVSVGQILVSLLVVSLGGGLGRRLIHPREINQLAALSLQSAAGLGLLGVGLLIVSALIGVNIILCWTAVFILGLLFWRDTWYWLSSWKALAQLWDGSGRFGKALGFGILTLLLCALLTSLAPPVKFDALVYHLTLPRLYLNSGGFKYIPEIMFWGMPQVGEMLYTWGMGLAGNSTAVLVGWWAGVLAMTGLIGYTADRFGVDAGWVAATSLISGYTLIVLLSAGYVEWFTILFGVGLLILLDIWWKEGDRSTLLWAGILCGLAMGSKYTGGNLLIAGMGVVLIHSLARKQGITPLVMNLAAFLVPAFVIFCPWLIKNMVATGNPFYPLLFPAGSMDQYRLEAYQLPAWGDWKDVLLLPLQATIAGFEGAPGYSASISPVLIALAPFSLIGFNRRAGMERSAIIIAMTIGIAGWIAWLFASRFSGFLIQTRFYFGLFPAFAVLVGAGYQALANVRLPGLRLERIVAALVGMVLLFNVIQVLGEFVNSEVLKVSLGYETTDDYLSDRLGWYFPAAQAVRELPEGSRVLMLWEPRSFYCLPKCIPDEILDQWRHSRQTVGEPGEILKRWREQGYTHLLYNRFGADFVRNDDKSYQESDWTALDDLLFQLKDPVEFGGAYELYSIQP